MLLNDISNSLKFPSGINISHETSTILLSEIYNSSSNVRCENVSLGSILILFPFRYRYERLGTESIRTQVNSYLSQFVLTLVNSYSVFGQFVLILLNLVNSYSFWSIRTQFGQFVLIPKI